MRVSEGINLKFVLTKKLVFFFKHRASEIRVKRIRVNRGVGVQTKMPRYLFLKQNKSQLAGLKKKKFICSKF